MSKHFLTLIFILFFFSIRIQAQIIDNFEDANLDGWGNIADWSNSDIEPITGSRALKHGLSNVVANSFIFNDLSSLSLVSKTVIWRFNLKNGNWDPASTSRFWFYLNANESNLVSATVDGYAVGIDFGTSDDLLTIWKVTNGAPELVVVQSAFDWNSSNLVGISVSRTTSGLWTLMYDANGNFDNLITAGQATNTDYTFNNYCGLVFNLTNIARAGQLWLDDLEINFDNSPPQIISAQAIGANTLRISFSENLNQTQAENTANYSIDGVGAPNSAVLNANQSSVDLTFSTAFIENQSYTVNVAGVSDISDNLIIPVNVGFVYTLFKLDEVYAISPNELLLKFSHPLNAASAGTISNYSVNNGIGNPTSAILISDSVVRLSFTGNFTDNASNELIINDLANIYGITINAANAVFTWHVPQAFDLIINELMVDINPAPNVLPAAKYIELKNRSNYSLYLSGWKLQIGDNSPIILPDFAIDANDQIIICGSSQTSKFSLFGGTLGVLSESQLTTTGKQIYLYNNESKLIDYIKYSDLWYKNTEKSDGGWSLERIDEDNFCGEAQNWTASTDFKGGTPGTVNSVTASNPDNSKPQLLSIEILSSYKLALYFSKNIDSGSGLNTVNYLLDDGANIPALISFPDTSFSTVILQFTSQFTDGQQQTLQINNLTDFCGNTIDPISVNFTYFLIHPTGAFAETDKIVHLVFSEEVEIVSGQTISNYFVDNGIGSPTTAIKHSTKKNEVYLEFSGSFTNKQTYTIHIELVKDLDGNIIRPEDISFVFYEPQPNELIINEILFNPKPSGVDFVEIYNNSGYPVDLSKLSLATRNEEGILESIKPLSETNLLYETGHFMAISTDSTRLKYDYPAIDYDKFLQIPSMPSFNDDEGVVVLLFGETVIDEFAYNQDMHFGLISNPEGISLERIDPDKETQLSTNWMSAAESKGYATPANQNSQFRKFSESIDDEIVIDPVTFSPNSDGYNDLVFIRYKFNEPGYVANVSVYDGKGRLLKRLASNELLATEGEFSWDGLSENGIKAGIGIYVIYFEVFNLQGAVNKFKKVCVLAEKLK